MSEAKTVKFNFKSRVIKDELGNSLGRTKKQDSVEAAIPVLNADEIIEALQTPDSAVAKLILEAIAGVVIDAARGQFDDIIESFGEDDTKVVSADQLVFDKLTLEYIASIPPTQRGGPAISEEEWEQFYGDYLVTMVQATGKEEARIKKQLELFKKPQRCKTNKEVLAVLVDQLNVYMAASSNLDETGTCADRLLTKFNRWYVEPEAVDVAGLL